MPRMLALLALASLTGCAAHKDEASSSTTNATVDDGTDTIGTESDTESLTTALVGGSSGNVSLASAAELAGGSLHEDGLGDGAKALFSPSGCLTVTADASAKKATYVFAGCTGPFGLASVSGTVTVTFSSPASNQLTLAYAASSLSVNHATVDWSATATVTGNGTARDMIWDGKLSGTTGAGRAFQRTNHKEYKWTAGQHCLSVSGSSDGTISGRQLTIDVTNFSKCKAGCPEAGSEIKVTDVAANKAYDVTWNAGNAVYTGPNGTATFTPLCAR